MHRAARDVWLAALLAVASFAFQPAHGERPSSFEVLGGRLAPGTQALIASLGLTSLSRSPLSPTDNASKTLLVVGVEATADMATMGFGPRLTNHVQSGGWALLLGPPGPAQRNLLSSTFDVQGLGQGGTSTQREGNRGEPLWQLADAAAFQPRFCACRRLEKPQLWP
jgi:hypothetical protein